MVRVPATFPVPVPPADPAVAIRQWAGILTIPDGLLAGRHFQIDDWQLAFLRDALAPGVREAVLSVARKNGKSAICALMLLAHLCGPLHRPGWRGLVASITAELSKELRHQIEAIAGENALPVEVRRSPTPGEVLGPNRCRLSFLACDKATGHALGADVALFDELGLLPEAKRDVWNAVRSSVSGRDGEVIAISIQGDSPMMRELMERKGDPAVAVHKFAAPDGCKIDDATAWHVAYPGLRLAVVSKDWKPSGRQSWQGLRSWRHHGHHQKKLHAGTRRYGALPRSGAVSVGSLQRSVE